MSDAIFLLKDGVQCGPYTQEEIKARCARHEICGDNFIWWEGIDHWIRVGDCEFARAPKPLQPLGPAQVGAQMPESVASVRPNQGEVPSDDNRIHFRCSYCERPAAVDKSAAGMTVQCTKCQRSVTVPQESMKPIVVGVSGLTAINWLLGAVVGWIVASIIACVVIIPFEPNMTFRSLVMFLAGGVGFVCAKRAAVFLEARREKDLNKT